jgi:hypothetical protein
MTKATRRDPYDVKRQEREELQRQIDALTQKLNPVDEALAIEAEKREAEDNQYLGAIVRLLLKDDHGLHRRMVDHAEMAIKAAKSPTKARKSLLRVLGPLPVPQMSADTMKAAKGVITEFGRTGK